METRYFLYTPANDFWETEIHLFDSKEQLEKEAAGILYDQYCDDGWAEETEQAFAGYGEFLTMDEYKTTLRNDDGEEDDFDHDQYENYISQFKKYTVEMEVTDTQSDYHERGEEWPYNPDYDFICRYDIEHIKDA